MAPIRRYPDAAVGHGDSQDDLVGIARAAGSRRQRWLLQTRLLDGFDPHHHLALRGELHRVAQQIQQHLPQPRTVALDGTRQRRREIEMELQPLVAGHRLEQPHRVAHALRRIEGLVDEREATGLDLRKVENVIENRGQGLGARMHQVDAAALPIAQRRSQQQFRMTEDAMQGCADLVTDRGQEFAFGAVGQLGRPAGFRLHAHHDRGVQQAIELGADPLQFAPLAPEVIPQLGKRLLWLQAIRHRRCARLGDHGARVDAWGDDTVSS